MRTRVLLDRLRVRRPVHAGEGDDEAVVELLELRALLAHDVADLVAILARQDHAHVARVAEARDALEELRLRELGRQREQRSADRGREVDLLREADPGVILNNADRLVHATREVERLPVEQVRAEVVDSCYPIFDGLRKDKVNRGFPAALTGLTTPFMGT